VAPSDRTYGKASPEDGTSMIALMKNNYNKDYLNMAEDRDSKYQKKLNEAKIKLREHLINSRVPQRQRYLSVVSATKNATLDQLEPNPEVRDSLLKQNIRNQSQLGTVNDKPYFAKPMDLSNQFGRNNLWKKSGSVTKHTLSS